LQGNNRRKLNLGEQVPQITEQVETQVLMGFGSSDEDTCGWFEYQPLLLPVKLDLFELSRQA
jgi:hypothetical protein